MSSFTIQWNSIKRKAKGLAKFVRHEVTGEVARKSSRPKLCRPKPELNRPKCGVMSAAFYQVKCTGNKVVFFLIKECMLIYLVLLNHHETKQVQSECVIYLAL